MTRNGQAVALVAIVAAFVGSEEAASDCPGQELAAKTSVSGLARSAPPAADPEIRHSVLMAGRPVGSQTGRRSDDGTLHFVYAYNDRGRGPSLNTRVVLGSGLIPQSIETDGNDYYKKNVRDRFAIVEGKGAWQNSAERGITALPPGTSAFYLSSNGVPGEMGLLAQALLAAPDKTLAILPSGKATIDRVGRLEVKSGDAARFVTQYEISGLSFTPIPVWLDHPRQTGRPDRGRWRPHRTN